MKRYHTYLAENQRFEMGLPEAQNVLVKYKIGDGGFGEVWRVSHVSQPKNYALKHINVPRLIEMQRIGPEDKDTLIERIKREASVRVASEYVVKCYGHREIEGNFFLLSDFVAGENLRFWISDHLEMGWPAKKAMFLKILYGVRDLHRAGIVHRDLKPSNILITLESQIPKIIDFGLAKLDDSTLTMTGDFSGSKFYKDPGLIRAWEGIKSVDQTSDVYALGILLYEMIMGQNPWHINHLPYEDLFNQITGKEHVLDIDACFRLDAAPEDVEAVQDLLRLSTRFDRSARLQSVDDMLARLSKHDSGGRKKKSGQPAPSEQIANIQNVSGLQDVSDSPEQKPKEEKTPHQPVPAQKFFDSGDRRHSENRPASKPFEQKEPSAVRPRKKTKKLSGMLTIGIVLAAAVGVAYAFRGDMVKQLFNRETPVPVVSTPTPANVGATPMPTAAPTLAPAPASTPTTNPARVRPTPMPTAAPTLAPALIPTTFPVADLLNEAQVYLEASQFTSPPGKNALETYQQILSIDPENAEAKEGLMHMLNTYAARVDGNCLKARGYYPHFRQIAQYLHNTLHDDALKRDAIRAEQAFQGCDL